MRNDRPTTPFAGLAEAAAQWLPEQVAQSWSTAREEMAKAPAAAGPSELVPEAAREVLDYWVDAAALRKMAERGQTSRADSVRARMASCAIAALLVEWRRQAGAIAAE
jgi:hypothetical protein